MTPSPKNEATQSPAPSAPSLRSTQTTDNSKTTPSSDDIVSPALTKTTICHFLDIAPPEIRNRIYDLIFTPSKSEGPIELACCVPPPNALLLTWQQVYGEAREMYRAACCSFWSENEFRLLLGREGFRPYADYVTFIATLRDERLSQVRRMTLKEWSCEEVNFIDGAWYAESKYADFVAPTQQAQGFHAAGVPIEDLIDPMGLAYVDLKFFGGHGRGAVKITLTKRKLATMAKALAYG